MMVHSQAVALRIAVRKEPPLQHLVRRKADSGNNMGRVESRLLDLGKVVFRILVQFENTHLDQRIILMVPDFAEIKGIVRQVFRLFFRHDLHVEGPAGEISLLNTLVKVTLVAFPVLAYNRLGLLIGQVLNALLGLQVELDPISFVLGVDKAEGVAAEAMHMAVAGGYTPIAHDDGNLMESLGQRRPEIPVVQGAAHIVAGIAFYSVVKVGKLERIAQEEYRRIISDKVPVAFLGVKLHRKAADITFGVGCAALAGNRGKAQEAVGLFTDLRKDFRFGVFCNVMGYSEGSISAGTFGMHTTFGDDLPVKVGQLLQKPDILQKGWAARPGGHNVLVINYRSTGSCC